MALTTPATYSTNQTLTASNLNTYLRDNMAWLATDAPHCRVYNSGTFSLTSGAAAAAITFDSERVDVGGCHSTSVNTARLTVPSGGGGFYIIGGHLAIAASSGGSYRTAAIRVNGSTVIAQQTLAPLSASIDVRCSITTAYQLAATDYVELLASQDSGGALNVLAAGNYTPEFWMKWVST
jgi:hypothetical protein